MKFSEFQQHPGLPNGFACTRVPFEELLYTDIVRYHWCVFLRNMWAKKKLSISRPMHLSLTPYADLVNFWPPQLEYRLQTPFGMAPLPHTLKKNTDDLNISREHWWIMGRKVCLSLSDAIRRYPTAGASFSFNLRGHDSSIRRYPTHPHCHPGILTVLQVQSRKPKGNTVEGTNLK